MADFKTRVITGLIVAPLIVFLLHRQVTTALLAHCTYLYVLTLFSHGIHSTQ